MTQLTPPTGTTTISTIAVLENARRASDTSTKNLLFDAHIFVENAVDPNQNCQDDNNQPCTTKGMLASLRYFNVHDYVFEDIGAYFITANVVKVHDVENDALPKIASTDLNNEDYALVGDIVSLIPASLEHASSSYAYLHATGYLTSVVKDTKSQKLMLDMAPEQYTHVYKDYNKKPGVKKTSIPLRCIIDLDSPRWKSRVPNFQVGHIVIVSGFLNYLRRKEDGKIKVFEVNVDQVNILGKASVPIRALDTTAQATPSPLKRKGLQFDFSQGSPSPSKRPRTSNQGQLSSQPRSQTQS